MDPLSVTASIVGIDVQDLAAEVLSLADILRILPMLASRLGAAPFTTTFRTHHITRCQEPLVLIETSLGRAEADFKRSWARRMRRRLQWPFSEAETKNLLTDMSRHRGDIGLALGTDCVTMLFSSLNRIDQLDRSLAGISNGVQQISFGVDRALVNGGMVMPDTTIYVDENLKNQVIGLFLDPTNESRLKDVVNIRAENTGTWLASKLEFRHWLRTPGSRLWLRGCPGSRKTILAGFIIQEALCRRIGSVGVAYFFGNFSDCIHQTPAHVLGSLVAELAKQNLDAFQALQTYYKSLHRPSAPARAPTIRRLVGLLHEISESFDQIYIVVDGLDKLHPDVTSVLSDLSGPDTNISMALTSRHEHDIQQRLLHHPSSDRVFPVVDIEHNVRQSGWDSDIEVYINTELRTNPRFQRWSEELKRRIAKKLSARSDGK
ncbi:hypothetical protein B0H66DRAFT_600309 [Apodospora peruviana]|uniref:Nephrocystin 3-like N-terminal domain-containing protein n=1 Tax=Apodospora peruviana TaxID=516989 RepID=A0AAE0IJP5_9PEZI|nr:hypothetical protein B0H66DRAFT_600309 [Apodospora peruviana]